MKELFIYFVLIILISIVVFNYFANTIRSIQDRQIEVNKSSLKTTKEIGKTVNNIKNDTEFIAKNIAVIAVIAFLFFTAFLIL